METEWYEVPGWSRYQVNRSGNIRSLHGRQPKILAPDKRKSGNDWIELYRNGEFCQVAIIEIVATVFLGPRKLGDFPVRINEDGPPSADNVRYASSWTGSPVSYSKGIKVPFSTTENAKMNAKIDIVRKAMPEEWAKEVIDLIVGVVAKTK